MEKSWGGGGGGLAHLVTKPCQTEQILVTILAFYGYSQSIYCT